MEERVEDITDLFPGLQEELRPGYFVEHVEAAANPLYERIHTLVVTDIQRFSAVREQLRKAVDYLRVNPADNKARTAASQLYTAYTGLIQDLETFLMPAGTYQPTQAYERISSDELDRIAATSYAHAAN